MTKTKLMQFRIRMENELLDWARQDAAHNKRSLNAEIVFCIERHREIIETKKASEAYQANSDASEQ